MRIKETVFLFLLGYSCVKSSVLLVSNRKFEVSPLEPFSNQELNDLRSELGYPNAPILFASWTLFKDWQNVTPNYYTSYNPNGLVYPNKDYIHLQNHNSNKSAVDVIQNYATSDKGQPFFLAISNLEEKLYQPHFVKPRFIADDVLYIGHAKFSDSYVMLYSSHYIKLETPAFRTKFSDAYNASVAYISNATVFTLQLRSLRGLAYNLTIVFKDNAKPHWSIPPLILTNATHSNVSIRLEPVKRMFVLKGYTFICGGVSRFVSRHTGVEIKMYNIHIEPHAINRTFSKPYSCNDYVSPAIIEGLFIIIICVVGLAVGMFALSNIKHN